METIKFNHDLDSGACIDIVKRSGAVLVRGYIKEQSRSQVLTEASQATMRLVNEQDQPVRQQFETINYLYPDEAGPNIRRYGARLIEFVGRSVPGWVPNDVAIQRYLPEHTVGIDPHRDYARDKLLVAVASLTGEADFHIELDSPGKDKVWSKQKLRPGDLVLMRAPGLTGAREDRPRHQIDPPRQDPRVSMAFRHNIRLTGSEDRHGNG